MKVQFNNFYNPMQYRAKGMTTFRAQKHPPRLEHPLEFQVKNPIISEDVREMANRLNDFYVSIENKTLKINDLEMGYPVTGEFVATKNINGDRVELNIFKNSAPSMQVGSIKFKIKNEDNSLKQTIIYYPQQQSKGKWMDSLFNYEYSDGKEFIKSTYEPEAKKDIPMLCRQFVKYANSFMEELGQIKNLYKNTTMTKIGF